MTIRRLSRAVPLTALLLAVATSASAATPGTLPSVTALNQKPKGDAVDITYAYLPMDGRVQIYSGDPQARTNAAVVGSIDLTAGDHRDFKVQLTTAPKSGERLWAAVNQAKANSTFPGSNERAKQSFKAL
jgi:hypothetical protein